MSGGQEQVENIIREMVRLQLKSNEKMTEAFEAGSNEEVRDAILQVFDDLVSKADDLEMERKIVVYVEQLGMNLGSEVIVNAVHEHIEESDRLELRDE